MKEQRRDVLLKYGTLIRENLERLRWLEAVSVGKDYVISTSELNLTADTFVCTGTHRPILHRQSG